MFSVKRSDHFHEAKDVLCKEGEAWCWMNCRPLANNGTCPSGDEMVCFSSATNVTCGTDPDDPNPIMDDQCKWQCMPKPDPVYRYSSLNLDSLQNC